MTVLYAVSDLHGHVDELRAALVDEGLVDDEDRWTGRDAHLWFLGDFFDRGPDGIAVLDLVRRLVEESGGAVSALLGNHEILALGMRAFGAADVPHDEGGPRSFERSWVMNGGLAADQDGLTDDRVEWLLGLPFVGLDGDHLLVHSDNLNYLEWGGSVEAVNAAGRETLLSDDLGAWWELWRQLTERYAFRGDDGADAARAMLDTLGGERVVHGHSIAAELAGVPYTDVTEALSYADGLVLAIDGGIYEGGPCLLTRLE